MALHHIVLRVCHNPVRPLDAIEPEEVELMIDYTSWSVRLSSLASGSLPSHRQMASWTSFDYFSLQSTGSSCSPSHRPLVRTSLRPSCISTPGISSPPLASTCSWQRRTSTSSTFTRSVIGTMSRGEPRARTRRTLFLRLNQQRNRNLMEALQLKFLNTNYLRPILMGNSKRSSKRRCSRTRSQRKTKNHLWTMRTRISVQT
jgi:hypothetical protein